MTEEQNKNHEQVAARSIDKRDVERLIRLLESQGYTVIGPVVQDEAIIYAEIGGMEDLPQGYHDAQGPGKYRLSQTGHANYFEFNVGPHSWKQFLFPPKLTVGTSHHDVDGWKFDTPSAEQPKFAFLGVRACELAAIAVQDRVFMQGPYIDPVYKARRESTLLIAVNCTVAAATCFCTSTDTGPKCLTQFDLALTELDDRFVVEVGTERGQRLLDELNAVDATGYELDAAKALEQRAVDQISKRLDTHDIRNLLLNSLEHPPTGRSSYALSIMYELHHGLPDLFLQFG
ncbi:MAG: hypothetical protein R3C53_01130 [Pirellulaceae bacterium]